MSTVTDIFSTREISLFVWLLIIALLFLWSKSVRSAADRLLKNFFVKSIFTWFVIQIGYVASIISVLVKIGLWDITLLKDTVLWFITVAFIMFVNVLKVKDSGFFREALKDTLKWTVILEFMVNFYTFSLLTELFLVPLMIFLGATLGFSQANKKHESVTKLLRKIIDAIGVVIFIVVIVKTIQKYQDLLTLHALNSLLHPIIMTVLILPYIYCFALYIRYDELFTLAKNFAKDKRKWSKIKRQIMWHGNLSLSRLLLIRRRLHTVDFSRDNMEGIIKRLIQ